MPDRGGLEDVVACTTEICAIDGAAGRLSYRGYDVRALAGRVPFEDVCHLLWTGSLPDAAESAALRRTLAEAYALPEGFGAWLARLPAGPAMAALRTAVSGLGMHEADGVEADPAAQRERAVRLTAQVAWVAAALWRLGRGGQPLSARPGLGHAANFLYMLSGAEPSPAHVRAMDIALVLHADHELNASTFAARVTAATLADMHAAVTSAVGTLAGPLHGGAAEAVMHAVQEVGSPEAAQAWVRRTLAAGRKVPGFGHRVYRTIDPRAAILRGLARELAETSGDRRPYLITTAVEAAMRAARADLYPNVDLYSGEAYRLIGIPGELLTAVFAVARVSGWTAHIMEQYQHNRLIRPRARYVGPEHRELAASG